MDETQIGLEDPVAEETGNTSDGEPTVEDKVYQRFGNDPDQLAKGYANLEAKLAEQGQELGLLRKIAEQSVDANAEATNGAQSGESNPADVLMQKLDAADENGGVSMRDLASLMMEAVNESVGGRIGELENTLGTMGQAMQFNQMVGNREDADKISGAVQEILREDPSLLPQGMSGEALNKRMDMLVQLAEKRSGSKAGRLVTRAESGLSRARQGSSAASDNADKLAQRYVETNSQQDLTALVGAVLARQGGKRGGGRFGR